MLVTIQIPYVVESETRHTASGRTLDHEIISHARGLAMPGRLDRHLSMSAHEWPENRSWFLQGFRQWRYSGARSSSVGCIAIFSRCRISLT